MPVPPPSPSPRASYGVAVLAVALATAARLALDPVLGDTSPFATMFLAVLAVAAYGGRGPALLAAGLGAFAAAYFLLAPRGSFAVRGVENVSGLTVYLLTGAGVAVLGGALRAARGRAEAEADAARRESEQARVTVASIGDGVIVTDAHGRVTSLNPVAEALTGWPEAEARGRPIAEVFRAADEATGAPIECPAVRALREGVVVGLANHTTLTARDGTERAIDDSAAPVRDGAGSVLGAVLVFRDVSERRRADRALAESEARNAAALRSALDAVITIDRDGRVVEWNPAAETTFGYDRAAALGRELAELIVPPSLREAHRAGLARHLATGEARILGRRVEVPGMRAGGAEFPCELSVARIAADGPPLFTAHVRDLTEERNLERRRAARLAVTEALAAAGSLAEATPAILRAVGEALGWDVGAVWLLDEEAGNLACVDVWARPGLDASRFEADSRVRRYTSGLGLPGRVWATGRAAWIADVAVDPNFPRGPIAAAMGLHGAFGAPVTLGESFLGAIEFYCVEVREPDPDLLEMMATLGGQVGQFLERKRSEDALRAADRRKDELVESLRAAKEEAEEANRAKTQFLAVLSHELRTPLNPILLAATSMLERPPDPEEVRPALEMIRQYVLLQARLIDDLLDVMRIVRGKMPLHWEVADGHALIGQALHVCRSEVFGSKLQTRLDLAATHYHLNADPARLQQVFWNLIKNAVKFTPEGGSIAIRTRNEPAGDDHEALLIVEVTDTGIGIAPEVLPGIFDPFQQGETTITRRFGGLGLGLAICKGVVEAHGGTIAAESAGRGHGTTFRVTLKALPDPAPEAAGAPARGPSPAASVGAGAAADAEAPPAPLRILVVEDEPATLRMMARLLGSLGHEVTPAATVAAAAGAAEAAAFDLVVSDIGLPDGSGLDLMRRVVSLRGHVPAIALTGYGMEEDIRRSREAGFTAHLTKPIDFAKLEAMIRQVTPARA